MTEDKIKNLLRDADHTAGEPKSVFISILALRRRANRRRLATTATVFAAFFFFFALLSIRYAPHKPPQTPGKDKVLSLEAEVRQLNAKMDATLNLIQEVLEEERRVQRLNELQTTLANIPDPIEETQVQVDKTAFILVYQADRLYRQSNNTDSAVQTYNQVIKLFPKNRWAEVARQRLTEIENRKPDEPHSKGGQIWKPQSV